jgi:hypothetical protein
MIQANYENESTIPTSDTSAYSFSCSVFRPITYLENFMTFITNHKEFGGHFFDKLTSNFSSASSVTIATGYISYKTLNTFEESILEIIRQGGRFTLIVGMGYFEGFKEKQLGVLKNLNKNIKIINPEGGGVKLLYTRKYHGKIYQIKKEDKEIIYIGSSNFSGEGLRDNVEANVEIKDDNTKENIKGFLDWLDGDKQSAFIDKIEDLKVKDSKTYKKEIAGRPMKLKKILEYKGDTINPSMYPHFDISLSRNIQNRQKSSFNTYFGAGRRNKETGKVIPRKWYEGELIVSADEVDDPLYPKGKFEAITDDGFTFGCLPQGENHKNLRSTGELDIWGKWIKSKLQQKNALDPLAMVTEETFIKYGRDTLRMYKLSDTKYYLEF